MAVLETCLGGVDVHSLSLRDNSLEHELLPVVLAVSQMQHLTKLDLSGLNFPNLKRGAKNATAVSNVLLEIVKLIGEEESVNSTKISCSMVQQILQLSEKNIVTGDVHQLVKFV